MSKLYAITLPKNLGYAVEADSEEDACNRLANYLVKTEATNMFYTQYEVQLMAENSRYKTEDAFVAAANLKRCGRDNIYVEIISVEEV